MYVCPVTHLGRWDHLADQSLWSLCMTSCCPEHGVTWLFMCGQNTHAPVEVKKHKKTRIYMPLGSGTISKQTTA